MSHFAPAEKVRGMVLRLPSREQAEELLKDDAFFPAAGRMPGLPRRRGAARVSCQNCCEARVYRIPARSRRFCCRACGRWSMSSRMTERYRIPSGLPFHAVTCAGAHSAALLEASGRRRGRRAFGAGLVVMQDLPDVAFTSGEFSVAGPDAELQERLEPLVLPKVVREADRYHAPSTGAVRDRFGAAEAVAWAT